MLEAWLATLFCAAALTPTARPRQAEIDPTAQLSDNTRIFQDTHPRRRLDFTIS